MICLRSGYNESMNPALFVRPLTPEERAHLQQALRAPVAFGLRRAQYLLASARGLKPQEIAKTYGGCQQTVRNVIRTFHARGLDCLTPNSNRPKSVQPTLSDHDLTRLQHLLHQSPRTLGKNQSTWTQQLLAEVVYEQGFTEQPLSDETIRRALKRLGANWKRAKHWISSPDPNYTLKKSGANA